MGVILSLTTLAFLLMVQVVCALNTTLPVVQTVSSVTLISGKEALLTCKYSRKVYDVYWRYENTTSSRKLLVALDNYFEVGKRSGPGHDEGRFNITDDHSLIIHNVQVSDEGTYICEVGDYETGSVLRNHTNVTTVVIAERPFIRIGQCEDDVSADEINEPCVLHTTPEDRTVQLTCTVVGAKPTVDLTWEASISSDQWKQVVNESTLTNKDRGNGIFDQTLTVNVDTSYIKSKKQHFTCVGNGLAVDGMANHTIAVVYVPQNAQGVNIKLTVVLSVICILLFTFVIIIIMGVLWKVSLRDKRRSRDAALRKKINKINDMKADEPVYLGLIGDKGAGKSSFIRYLIFLVQGQDESTPQQAIKGDDADNPSEIWECTEFISEGLRIRKTGGEEAFKAEAINAILLSIKEDIPPSSRDLIHYPIFVFDVSNTRDLDNRIKLLNDFSEKFKSLTGKYPMLVLTYTTATAYKKELKELIKKIHVPRGNILVTFHYFDADVISDELKRADILDFILKCLAKADEQKRTKLRLRTEWEKGRYIPVPQSKDTVV